MSPATPRKAAVTPTTVLTDEKHKTKRKSFWDIVFFQNDTEVDDKDDAWEPRPIDIGNTAYVNNSAAFANDDRWRVAYEIYTSEVSYTRSLDIILKYFVEPLQDNKSPYFQLLPEDEIKTIFPVIKELHSFHSMMLTEIETRIKTWSQNQLLGDLTLKYSPFFKIYAQYCKNYEKSNNSLMEVSKRKLVAQYLESMVRRPESNQPDLQSYLIQPVQRLPRVLLLLTDLQRKTPKTHEDYDKITKSLVKVKEIIDAVNEAIGLAEKAFNFFQESAINVLMAPHRICVRKGTVTLENVATILLPYMSNPLGSKEQNQKLGLLCTAFLFNDIFVITSNNRMMYQFSLDTLWILSTDTSSFTLKSPDKYVNISIAEKKDGSTWIQQIKDTIDHHVKKQNPRSASFSFSDGTVYKGEWSTAMLDGFGVLSFPNGNHYEGTFKNNYMDGEGQFFYANGDTYQGKFASNKFHGHGTLSLVNGTQYTGDWFYGQQHGDGKLFFKDSNDAITGKWKNGFLDGYAELHCPSDGSSYKGDWFQNRRHGNGILSTPTFVYQGQFVHDQREGKGILTESGNGNRYEGHFKANKKNGHGNLTTASYVYDGDWENDMFEAKGTLKTTDGNLIYDGEWHLGLKHGFGISHSPEGRFEGQFKNGLREGDGKMVYANGEIYEGQWKNDRKEGKGKLSNYEGVYEGNFLADCKEGEGAMSYADGRKYYGSFKSNMKDGQGVLIVQSGKYDGKFKTDKKDGKGTFTDRTGKYTGYFRNDKPHGKGTFISIVDNSVYEGEWLDGVRHGRGTLKQFDGSVIDQLYKNGILQDSTLYMDTSGPLLPSMSSFLL